MTGDDRGLRPGSPGHVAPGGMLHLWWLSFVDPDLTPAKEDQRPGGVSFLGVAIVEATDLISALRISHARGCNPGGEVQSYGPLPTGNVPGRFLHRLLTSAEAEEVPDPWG